MRKGLTLLEVIVTIAVVAILVALLLPAVQRARESARRATCQNKLRQISLACTNYQLTYGCYPPGVVSGLGSHRSNLFSQHVFLLPSLELHQLYNSLNFSLRYDNPANSTVARSSVSMLLCPSDFAPAAPSSEIIKGFTNYAGCFGSGNWERIFDGVFQPTRPRGIITDKDIIDGLAHTVCFSEWIHGQMNGNQVTSHPDGSGMLFRTTAIPACREEFVRNCQSLTDFSPDAPLGFDWLLGAAGCSWYNHQITPNGKSCMIYGNKYPAGDVFSAFTASSRHVGG